VIALVCPALLRLDLVKACKDYEQKYGGAKELGGAGTAWHRWEMRAFRVQPGARVIGLRAAEAEALLPQARVFVQRIRRNGVIEEATAETVLQQGDVVAVVGAREALVSIMGERAKMLAASGSREMIASVAEQVSVEVDDAELLSVPVEGVDVYVTNKEVDGKTLVELAQLPSSRGVFLRKITRGAVATSIPILAKYDNLPRRHPYRGRPHPGHQFRNQDAGRPGSPHGRGRRSVHRRRNHRGRADRRSGVEGIRCSTDAVNRWWRIDLGTDLRVAALGSSQVRPDPDVDRLVHELGRSEHLHRHCGHFSRSGIH